MIADLGAVSVELEETTNTVSRELSPGLGSSGPTRMVSKQRNLSRENRAGFSVAKNQDSTSREL